MTALAVLSVALSLTTGTSATLPQAASEPVTCQGDIALAATVDRTRFQSRGREIEALLFRPTHGANGAGIVVLHGSGGLQRDLPRFEAHIGQWVSHGYTVIAPNYYDASRQSPRENPLVMDRWREAGDDAAKTLAAVDGVDDSRIGMWGFSLGGSLALDSILDNGGAKAAVLVAAQPRPGRGAPNSPILMLAGDHDPDLSLAAVEETARLLQGRGVPISVETYAADRHLLPPSGWCEVFDKSRAFFDRALGAPN